ncbi:transposase [Streptomyces sp. NPDC051133]|uniref:transposase n=1 Tax=Streptomyces sp. NPDC051133 TaxID=3155521 RepID=UPI003445B1D3
MPRPRSAPTGANAPDTCTAYRNRHREKRTTQASYLGLCQAVVIATGVTEDGGREVLSVMVGGSEAEAWGPTACARCGTAA